MRDAMVTTMAVLALTSTSFVVLASRTTHGAREPVIRITARKFEYSPDEITVKKGAPVVLEITSLDRDHGFKLREFGIRADIKPGKVTRIRIIPDKTGRFPFECDVFCGTGHEDMSGELVVTE
jgi:cytochrome c oxidase subunit 2